MNDLSEDYYSQKQLWDAPLSEDERAKTRVLSGLFPKGIRKVLDVGCGSGTSSNWLPHTVDVTGVDFSTEALRHYGRRKVVGSVDNLPFPEGEFDLVICSDILEHLRPKSLHDAVREIRRITRKYILVVSPWDEPVEGRLTACGKCGTRFHVNWHIHSFRLNDLVALFDGEFSPEVHAYFGEPWQRSHPILMALRRANNEYLRWELAVCPLCGTSQGSSPAVRSDDTFSSLTRALEATLDRTDRPGMPPHCEVAVLLRRTEVKPRIPSSPLSHERNCRFAWMGPEPSRVRVVSVRRNDLVLGQPWDARRNPAEIAEEPYILENAQMDWSDPAIVDGRTVRFYADRSGSDGHAVFVLAPPVCGGDKLLIEYKDVATEPVWVRVFLRSVGSQPLGKLEGTGDGKWKTLAVAIPDGVSAGRRGLIFDLVTDKPHPEASHPIHRISVGARGRKETCQELSKAPQELVDGGLLLMGGETEEWNPGLRYYLEIEGWEISVGRLFGWDGDGWLWLETETVSGCIRAKVPRWLMERWIGAGRARTPDEAGARSAVSVAPTEPSLTEFQQLYVMVRELYSRLEGELAETRSALNAERERRSMVELAHQKTQATLAATEAQLRQAEARIADGEARLFETVRRLAQTESDLAFARDRLRGTVRVPGLGLLRRWLHGRSRRR